MANIIIFDKATNKVKEYLKSVNTPDYDGRDDVLINPDLPSVDLKFMKIENGNVVEMSQEEKDAVIQSEDDALEAQEEEAINNFNVTNLEILTALVQAINKRIPSDPITKQELVDQIKANR